MLNTLRRFFIPAGLATLVLIAVAAWHEPMLGWVVYASGRADLCTKAASLDGIGVFNRQMRFASELRDSSRLIQKDEAAGLELWETPEGRFWAPRTSQFWEIFYDLAEQKRGIYSYHSKGVQPGDVVLDCGANIGLYAKTALDAGASKVIAIEPVPANLECLRRNLAKEIAAGQVVVVPKGVWHQEDWLEMSISEKNGAEHSFIAGKVDSNHKLRLPLTTIDQLVSDLGLTRVDYIKMDIEGAERNALAGGQQTMKRFHPRMALCVYHLTDDPIVIPQKVRSAWAGYRQDCGPCEPGEGGLHPQVFFYF